MAKKTNTSNHDIYLDNNATTRACDESRAAMSEWIQCSSNPSGSTKLSATSALLLNRTKEYLNNLLNLKNKYTILFTSGATESNCMLLRSMADSWIKRVGGLPHFISTSAEHHSIIECFRSMVDLNRAEVTLIDPNAHGIVDPAAVQKAIRKNTAMITVMYANNETGAVNPISQIAKVAHMHTIPFHTDAVQMFGKHAIDMSHEGIDALSMSFHKIYGPMGVGLLIIRDSLIKGYKLEAQICGTQQGGLRGGTENMPGIAGAAASLVFNFDNRTAKNKQLLRFRNMILDSLEKHYDVVDYASYRKKHVGGGAERMFTIVVMGPPRSDIHAYIPNTLLMSVVDRDRKICNIKIKKMLEQRGVIVSIGSACNTSSKKASHVLESMGAPSEVKRGVLRVSLGDYNTESEVKKFISIFLDLLKREDVWL